VLAQRAAYGSARRGHVRERTAARADHDGSGLPREPMVLPAETEPAYRSLVAELPDPIAEGDLDRSPFAHILSHVATRSITGTLVVWPEDAAPGRGQDRVRFEAGIVTAARLVDRSPMLAKGLLPLFARTTGPYALYETIDLVGESGTRQRVDPLSLIAASLRGPSRDDAVDRVLGQFAGVALRFKGAALDAKRLGLLPKEERFLDVIRASPATTDELVRQCELGEAFGKRLVYMFVLLKVLEPYEATRPSMPVPAQDTRESLPPQTGAPERVSGVPSPPTQSAPAATHSIPPASSVSASGSIRAPALRFKEAPPPPPEPPSTGLSADQIAFWRELIQRCKALDTQNYFDMLGVAREASAETVRKEYFALAKRWHPDRVAGPLLPTKPFVERVFGHLTQAHDTLTDEKRRGPYLRTVQDGGGTPESDRKLGAIVAASMENQKAEVLIRRRDFDGAVAILRGGLELNTDDADLHASLAWALFMQPNGKASEILAAADRAIAIAANHDRAHYARGMILRRMGREEEAVTHFRKAAEANPKNLDAVREARLADMRGTGPKQSGTEGKGVGSTDVGAFFSKLFSSPKKK
jgi:curved DNA-binding protein CbpA